MSHHDDQCNKIHQGVHAALDALFASMVETGALEGQAVVRNPAAAGAMQVTLKLLGPDDPPTDYETDDERIVKSFSGVWDPVTQTFVERRPIDT